MKIRPLTLGIAAVVIAAVIGLMVLALNLANAKGKRPTVGSVAPEFSISLYKGYQGGLPETVSLSDLRGKVVVINFWGSWCPQCHTEAEALQNVHVQFASRNVVFIGVDYLDTESAARGYLARYAITYANGIDVGQRIANLFRITAAPETFIIDTDGSVHSVIIGETTESALALKLEDALK